MGLAGLAAPGAQVLAVALTHAAPGELMPQLQGLGLVAGLGVAFALDLALGAAEARFRAVLVMLAPFGISWPFGLRLVEDGGELT